MKGWQESSKNSNRCFEKIDILKVKRRILDYGVYHYCRRRRSPTDVWKVSWLLVWTTYFKADAYAILGPPFCIPAYAISNATLFFQMLFRNLHTCSIYILMISIPIRLNRKSRWLNLSLFAVNIGEESPDCLSFFETDVIYNWGQIQSLFRSHFSNLKQNMSTPNILFLILMRWK